MTLNSWPEPDWHKGISDRLPKMRGVVRIPVFAYWPLKTRTGWAWLRTVNMCALA